MNSNFVTWRFELVHVSGTSVFRIFTKKLHCRCLVGSKYAFEERIGTRWLKKIFKNSYFLFRLYVGAPLSNLTGERQGAVFSCPSNKLNCDLAAHVDTSM